MTSPLPDSKNVLALAWRMDALAAGLDTVRGGPMVGEPMWLVRQLKEILKTAQAAAGRADGILSLTDVITAWSTQNPNGVQANVLRQALEQINTTAGEGGAVTVDVTPEQLAQAITAALATLRVTVTTDPPA